MVKFWLQDNSSKIKRSIYTLECPQQAFNFVGTETRKWKKVYVLGTSFKPFLTKIIFFHDNSKNDSRNDGKTRVFFGENPKMSWENTTINTYKMVGRFFEDILWFNPCIIAIVRTIPATFEVDKIRQPSVENQNIIL